MECILSKHSMEAAGFAESIIRSNTFLKFLQNSGDYSYTPGSMFLV